MRGLGQVRFVPAFFNSTWVNSGWSKNKDHLDRGRVGGGSQKGRWRLSRVYCQQGQDQTIFVPINVYVWQVEVILFLHFLVAWPTLEQQSRIFAVICKTLRTFHVVFVFLKRIQSLTWTGITGGPSCCCGKQFPRQTTLAGP